MPTLFECLRTLPEDMVLINLATVDREKRELPVREHLALIKRDEPGYEVREENHGRSGVRKAVGYVNGPTIFRQG